MKIPTVALVGGTNVGKSTLFNKLVGSKVSIILDSPGVTRDRIYETVTYKDYTFNLIDTGGIDVSKELFNDVIKIQAEIAVLEADVVVFLVDGKQGITANDKIISNMLLKSNKKIIVAINKFDNKNSMDNIYDFYELGFSNYIPISAEHNIGVYELLEEILKDLPKVEKVVDDRLKLAVIGRPNVGKSSLVNSLLNEERVIVSDVYGTTRDAVDTVFKYNKKEYVLIDTAGIRRKGKIFEYVEKYSLIRSLKAIDRSDICLLVINVHEGIIEEDKHIASYALEKGKGVIIVVNKWDLIEEKNPKKVEELIREEFKFLSYAPIVYLSALTKKRLNTLMPEIIRVEENINREIKTSILNDVISEAYSLNIPPSYKGKRLKIYFVSQKGVKPPKFIFNVNDKGLVHFSYYRYLENKLRENFLLEGTPIILEFKNRGE